MAWQPDYCTVAELKSFLRIPDSDDDTQIAIAITAASRAIDTYCNRQVGQVAAPEARIYTAEWIKDEYLYVVEMDDCQNISGMTVMVDTVVPLTFNQAITSFRLFPFNASQKG